MLDLIVANPGVSLLLWFLSLALSWLVIAALYDHLEYQRQRLARYERRAEQHRGLHQLAASTIHELRQRNEFWRDQVQGYGIALLNLRVELDTVEFLRQVAENGFQQERTLTEALVRTQRALRKENADLHEFIRQRTGKSFHEHLLDAATHRHFLTQVK